ncbi:MAG: hypothetical protein ABIK97_01185 [candidate division WOR-3 bacterium]
MSTATANSDHDHIRHTFRNAPKDFSKNFGKIFNRPNPHLLLKKKEGLLLTLAFGRQGFKRGRKKRMGRERGVIGWIKIELSNFGMVTISVNRTSHIPFS